MPAPELDASSQRFADLGPRAKRRLIARSILISVSLVTVMVAAYYLLPWDGDGPRAVVFRIVWGLLLLIVATVVAVKNVLRSQYPMMRAFEALVVVVGFAVVSFASMYVFFSSRSATAFSEELGKTDGLYFSLTTATTIGYGDITAKTEGARIVVMFQMIINVVVVGVGARAIVSAARRRAEDDR